MFKSDPHRFSVLVLLGILFVSGAASAERRSLPPTKIAPASVASAAENVFTRLGRLVRLWAANGAIVDPLGLQGNGAPAATVPTSNSLDDNGAIVDPMGVH